MGVWERDGDRERETGLAARNEDGGGINDF
jgi:hypothetical protein